MIVLKIQNVRRLSVYLGLIASGVMIQVIENRAK